MLDLSQEAQTLRERISRYREPTREELDRILQLEFEYVQLLDLILRLYSLNARSHEAIAYLEESRIWAGLSVKRGQQKGYLPSNSPLSSDRFRIIALSGQSESVELAFKMVLNAILSRCIPNREMDLAVARLDRAAAVLAT